MSASRPVVLAIAIAAVFSAIAAGAYADDYYVDKSATGSGTGGDWANAITSIEDGIKACSGTDYDTLHVAAATYTENVALRSYITMLGGYPPGGGTRDPETHETIIDGNDAGPAVTVYAKQCVAIDGFTIQNGRSTNGGGIYAFYSAPDLANCVVRNNVATNNGGGLYSYVGSIAFDITNCEFSNNACAYEGGAIFVYWGSPILTDCLIADNVSQLDGGGAYLMFESEPELTNCLICRNKAARNGGGVYATHSYCTPKIVNCTIADNVADSDEDDIGSGGGLYVYSASCSPEVRNSILWDNTPESIAGDTTNLTVTYSDVEGSDYGEDGGCTPDTNGNMDCDPLFVPLDDTGKNTGYYLAHEGLQAADSSCIDRGDQSASVYGLDTYTTATDGTPDDSGPVDMGYHYPEGYSGDDDRYVNLISFEASPADTSVFLTWETGAEIDNAGFVIYRTIAGTHDYQQISGLIAAEGGPTMGASYSFIDRGVAPATSYDYWLVDIEISGKLTAHGPVTARLPIRLDSLDRLESPSYTASHQPSTANHQPPTAR